MSNVLDEIILVLIPRYMVGVVICSAPMLAPNCGNVSSGVNSIDSPTALYINHAFSDINYRIRRKGASKITVEHSFHVRRDTQRRVHPASLATRVWCINATVECVRISTNSVPCLPDAGCEIRSGSRRDRGLGGITRGPSSGKPSSRSFYETDSGHNCNGGREGSGVIPEQESNPPKGDRSFAFSRFACGNASGSGTTERGGHDVLTLIVLVGLILHAIYVL